MTTVNWKASLQRWCQTHQEPLPAYNSSKDDQGLWVSTVQIRSTQVTGDPKRKKIDADMSVAELALSMLEESEFLEQERGKFSFGNQELKQDHIRRKYFSERKQKQSIGRQERNEKQNHIPERKQEQKTHFIERKNSVSERKEQLSNMFAGNNSIELTFNHNYADLDLIEHLQKIVRNKSVEITNNPSYPIRTAPVVLYLLPSQVNQIKSFLLIQGVKMHIPALPLEKMALQANLLVTLCMELGATSVAVVDTNFALTIPTVMSLTMS